MNSNEKKSNSLLFNLITLLTFGLTLFLIIFLKRGEGKKVEQGEKRKPQEKSRVKITPDTKSKKKQEPEEFKELNERQRRILAQMREEGKMSPSEIYSLVPGVSTRTVRRDMDSLVRAGFVSQKGTTKSTRYIYKD